jgi:mannose-6-phosphate isomerase-like protein (cupin superfamily)
MTFIAPSDMMHGSPLHGWAGSFFHAEHMTFALWEIAADAVPLHEHHHPYEEVWNVVEGSIALTVGGQEQVVGRGAAAVIPPNVRHSAKPIGPCRVVVTDWPRREALPGIGHAS